MKLVGSMAEELETWKVCPPFPRVRALDDAAQKQRGLWSVMCWERTHVVIEDGRMKGSKVEKLHVKASKVAAAADGSTQTKGLQLDDRLIKGGGNALVTSQLTLQAKEHQRINLIICEVADGVSDFHTKQNRDQRSVKECRDRSVEMTTGGFTSQLVGLLRKLVDSWGVVESRLRHA